jgi:hypothetical protein
VHICRQPVDCIKEVAHSTPAGPGLSTRSLLRTEPAADLLQHPSHDHGTSATTISTGARGFWSHPVVLKWGLKSTRQLFSSSIPAARPGVEHGIPKPYPTRSNQIVGGVFLHLARRMSVTSCSPRFSQKLAHACFFETVAGNQTESACAWIGL